jgi:phosphoribosyl-ATP pyrophosphohydrolase
MNKYLTTKLAEEAAEVAQAACKVLLHQDKQSRQVLLSEMADVQAMLHLCMQRLGTKQRLQMAHMVGARIDREVKKGKA